MAWAIGSKDIVDALKNKSTRTNIILMAILVVFFWWASTLRPFDKRIDTVVYDEGNSSLNSGTVELTDGYSFRFYEAASVHEWVMDGNYPDSLDMRLEYADTVIFLDFDRLVCGDVLADTSSTAGKIDLN
jgi:hypothetical protein